MALFGIGKRRNVAQTVPSRPAPQPRTAAATRTEGPDAAPKATLPPALPIGSHEEAAHALDAVGDLQRRFETGNMSDSELWALGDEAASRVQGVVDYFIAQGMEINLYSQVVEPMAAWAIGHLSPMWIMDQGATPRTAAAKHSYFVIAELMPKYERLKP